MKNENNCWFFRGKIKVANSSKTIPASNFFICFSFSSEDPRSLKAQKKQLVENL